MRNCQDVATNLANLLENSREYLQFSRTAHLLEASAESTLFVVAILLYYYSFVFLHFFLMLNVISILSMLMRLSKNVYRRKRKKNL